MDQRQLESIATTLLDLEDHLSQLRKITQPIINQVCIELEDEGKSDATINRVVSAVDCAQPLCI